MQLVEPIQVADTGRFIKRFSLSSIKILEFKKTTFLRNLFQKGCQQPTGKIPKINLSRIQRINLPAGRLILPRHRPQNNPIFQSFPARFVRQKSRNARFYKGFGLK